MKKILVAISFSAITILMFAFSLYKPVKTEKFDQKYFEYTKYPSQNPIDLSNSMNYLPTGNDGQDPLDCPEGSLRCGVLADDDGTGHPILSGATIFTRE